MNGIVSVFMLFVATIVGLLSYAILPLTPMTILVLVSALGLVGGLWWHWTQFSVEYRTSTWQEQLRNYAAYVMVGLVVIASYTIYVFGWSGVSSYISDTADTIQNTFTSAATATAASGSNVYNAVASSFNIGAPVANNRGRNINSNVLSALGIGNAGQQRNIALE